VYAQRLKRSVIKANMRRVTRTRLLSCLLLACAAAGCRKADAIPTEKMLVVKVPSAPGLSELTPHMTANHPVFWGEVFLQRRRFPDFQWEGAFEGATARRTGAIEAARVPLDGPTFVFGSDLIEADVPTSSWLCSKMGNPVVMGMPCAQGIRRTVASSGKLIAYLQCADPACPVAELSDGTVTPATVPALSALRVVAIGKRQVVLAWSHWMKSTDWTGRRVLVMLVAPPLQRIGDISLEEIDARDPDTVINRLGTFEILDDGLGFTGKRATMDRKTGAELKAEPIRERFVLTDEGKLVWKK
jgi:hypothetical protein